ncbi:4-alpha-glucanotransferase [Tistrella bauzanensis]
MAPTAPAPTAIPHGWRGWPEAFRDPRSPAVAAFARDHQDAVARALMLQWQASRGLSAAHQAARDAGMPVGLIADLAIGVDGSGAQAWSHQDQMLIGATIGAPPDLFNPLGQNWGLAAFSPRALAASGHAAYIQMLRAALRHAGGIRIDHILGLMRLWLIPEGAAPAEGAYLRYPLQDLLHATVLESRRHHAVVIGEDLGTVPAGFRDMLGAHGILGTRVLWFERDAGDNFLPPDRWERSVVATATTHDLPTTAGWWAGADIDWRERLGLFGPGETSESLRELRALDRSRLWSALDAAGSVDGIEPAPHASADPVIDGTLNFLGQTPTPLVLAPLEDLAGLGDQPNLPGTIAEHPNWRRRMPAPVPDLLETPAARRRLSRLGSGRRHKGDPS